MFLVFCFILGGRGESIQGRADATEKDDDREKNAAGRGETTDNVEDQGSESS